MAKEGGDSEYSGGLGRYDPDQNACLIDIHLRGVKHRKPGVRYEAILDTGFSGFIQLPLSEAIALGLPLEGTQTSVLADGSSVTSLTALGRTTFADRETTGVVILSPSSPVVLVGMDFLRKFDRALIVSRTIGIHLFDEPEEPVTPP